MNVLFFGLKQIVPIGAGAVPLFYVSRGLTFTEEASFCMFIFILWYTVNKVEKYGAMIFLVFVAVCNK